MVLRKNEKMNTEDEALPAVITVQPVLARPVRQTECFFLEKRTARACAVLPYDQARGRLSARQAGCPHSPNRSRHRALLHWFGREKKKVHSHFGFSIGRPRSAGFV